MTTQNSDSKTPLLDTLSGPEDLRRLDESRLPQLADELRREEDQKRGGQECADDSSGDCRAEGGAPGSGH